MTTAANKSIVSDPGLALRFCARTSAAILFVSWLAFVVSEAMRSNLDLRSTVAYPQAAALAVVFAGYAMGVRQELLGGMVIFLGMLAFYIVHVVTLFVPPDPVMFAFALPGFLYVLAWNDHRADVNSRARDL